MKANLLILPFLALLIGVLGSATGHSFPEFAWVTAGGWIAAAVVVGAWVYLDLANLKRLFGRKGTKYGASSGLVVLLGLSVIIGIGVLSNRPRFNKSIDVTRGSFNTLSDQSVKLISQIKEKSLKIEMAAFFQDEKMEREFRNLVQQFNLAGAEFTVEYVNPQAEPTKAIEAKLSPSTPNLVIFKVGALESRITTFTEEKFANALVNLMKSNGSKKVYFLNGHGEGEFDSEDAAGFGLVSDSLKNNKYELAKISLAETPEIPSDASLLILAGPKYDLKAQEVSILEKFLDKGGALLALLDAVTEVPNIIAMLEKYGIQVSSDLIILDPRDPRTLVLGQNNAIINKFDDQAPLTRDFSKRSSVHLYSPFTRTLNKNDSNSKSMKVSLVAQTQDGSIRIKGVNNERDLGSISPDRQERGSFSVIAIANGKIAAVAPSENTTGEAESKKETRIVAIGSSYFARNASARAAAEHRDLFTNSTNYLLQDEDFISIRPKDVEKSTISLASSQSQLTLGLLAYIYPFIFLGSGVFVWLKRRRA